MTTKRRIDRPLRPRANHTRLMVLFLCPGGVDLLRPGRPPSAWRAMGSHLLTGSLSPLLLSLTVRGEALEYAVLVPADERRQQGATDARVAESDDGHGEEGEGGVWRSRGATGNDSAERKKASAKLSQTNVSTIERDEGDEGNR